VVDNSYTKYIERIGQPPARMTYDYAAALEHSRVWVLETIAVSPSAQGLDPRHGYRETGRAVEDGFRRVYFSKAVRHNDVGDIRHGHRGDDLEGGGVPQ
jgi:hypothetical protein